MTDFGDMLVRDLLHKYWAESKVPAWIEDDITVYQVRDLAEHGCQSGVYMPAVEYATATQTMQEHSSCILDWVEDKLREQDVPPHPATPVSSRCWLPRPTMKWDVSKMSWNGLAVHMVSLAVEVWAGKMGPVLAQIEWDLNNESEMPDNEEVNDG